MKQLGQIQLHEMTLDGTPRVTICDAQGRAITSPNVVPHAGQRMSLPNGTIALSLSTDGLTCTTEDTTDPVAIETIPWDQVQSALETIFAANLIPA